MIRRESEKGKQQEMRKKRPPSYKAYYIAWGLKFILNPIEEILNKFIQEETYT